MTTQTLSPDNIHILGPDEGAALHVLGTVSRVKATAGDSGALTAVESVAPRGFGPPLHCHRDEDELVVVLEGEIEFRSGDNETVAGPGSCVYLPHGIPHTFQVLSETSRMVAITASTTGTPVFDKMFEAMEGVTDPGELALVNAQHGVDILGPPPAPLND